MSVSEDQVDRPTRAARNQTLFRVINERVSDLNQTFSAFTETSEWICESANHTCIQPIEMSAHEYEAVRKNAAHFFVAPSDEHVWPDVEDVIDRNSRYWIVAKFGRAGRLANEADPRSD